VDIAKVYRNYLAGTTGPEKIKYWECNEGEVVKKLTKNAKRLIAIGLLVGLDRCANMTDVVISGEGVEVDTLQDAVAILRSAEKQGAESVAPKTYLKTQQALSSLNSIIKRDPENKQAIQEATTRFIFEVEHLYHITQEVNELRSVQSEAVENVVLSAEYRLLAISDALKLQDPRQKNLYEQSVIIANAANEHGSKKSNSETVVTSKRHINKNELDSAYIKIKQLELQLEDVRKINNQLKLEQKPLKKRIESLERYVLELNEQKTSLEEKVRDLENEMKKPETPAG